MSRPVQDKVREVPGKVKARARQIQCKLEAGLGKGQGKVITMSRRAQDKVRESSLKGQGKVKEIIS